MAWLIPGMAKRKIFLPLVDSVMDIITKVGAPWPVEEFAQVALDLQRPSADGVGH